MRFLRESKVQIINILSNMSIDISSDKNWLNFKKILSFLAKKLVPYGHNVIFKPTKICDGRQLI